LIGLIVRRFGEPLRSAFSADAMCSLLAKHGFRVARDENVSLIAARLSAELGRATRPVQHLRVATADRGVGDVRAR